MSHVLCPPSLTFLLLTSHPPPTSFLTFCICFPAVSPVSVHPSFSGSLHLLFPLPGCNYPSRFFTFWWKKGLSLLLHLLWVSAQMAGVHGQEWILLGSSGFSGRLWQCSWERMNDGLWWQLWRGRKTNGFKKYLGGTIHRSWHLRGQGRTPQFNGNSWSSTRFWEDNEEQNCKRLLLFMYYMWWMSEDIEL